MAGGPAHNSQKPARAAGRPAAFRWRAGAAMAGAAMAGEPPPVEERRRLQEELAGFVESCRRTLEEVTSSLGWSLDRLDPGEEAAAEVRAAGPGRRSLRFSGGRVHAGRRGEGAGAPPGAGRRPPRVPGRARSGAPPGTSGLKKW